MFSTSLTTALLPLLAATCVSAAPVAQQWAPSSYSWSNGQSGQVAFKFPLSNGFPNIQVPSAALTAIEKQAHGTLPNTALPTSLSDTSASTFQAVTSGEIFEVAYFSAFLANITNNVPGYNVGTGAVKRTITAALTAIIAQEELHAIGLNAILSTAGRTPVQPCEYIFPVHDFDTAISGASTFTDTLALSPLQDVLNALATDGDEELVPLLASVLGQEGEQNGFYRTLQGLIPSALPFLTRGTGPFAYSYLNQNFVVPGSCVTPVDVPIFAKLRIDTPNVSATTSKINFCFTQNGTAPASTSDLRLVYINQQNSPIVQELQDVKTTGEDVEFTADFPYEQNEMNGLTIAVLTNSPGPFTSADAVANATVYGPAVIEIN